MKLIVGLGNPGRKYEGTRHNVGFEVIAELAKRVGFGRPKSKFHGEIAEVSIRNRKTLLLWPLTFMNVSGQSVGEAVDFYKLPLEDLLIVCDDLNLPTGRIRLRPGGSAGGQNGVKDIIRRLGDQQFARLRVGIDRPPPKWDAADYVLGKFGAEDSLIVQKAIGLAADAAETWVAEGTQIAMNLFNPDPQSAKKENKKKESSNRSKDHLERPADQAD